MPKMAIAITHTSCDRTVFPFYPSKNTMQKTIINLFSRLCLVALLPFLSACGGDDNDIQFGEENGQGSGGVVVTPSRNITSRMETPEVKTDGTTQLVQHSTTTSSGREVMAYCLEYDKRQHHSRWVAFRFDGDTHARNVSRSDEPFADDPKLSADLHIGSRGFGSGYDRGHLCASADRLYSREANELTFFMSNMSPQMSAFNQGYWVTLEGLVQKLGRNVSFADTLYVVKGGTVAENQVKTHLTRPNGTRVAVPKYYYMALLKVKNGVYSSVAFWMEHKNYGYTYKNPAPLTEIKKHACTVNSLEQKTGINFFPNLPNNVEESVEDQLITSNWGMQ